MKLAFFVDSVEFDRKVISGEASLGGSESSCLGLARALQARGHQVHIIATKLDPSCHGLDHAGVAWHPADVVYDLSQVAEWDVFCSLRMPYVFQQPIKARMRLLWNQDLMIGDQAKHGVMAVAWAYDHVVYVSEYHRKQWEGIIPELKPLGWVTKNGFDPAHVPAETVKRPNRIIHVSRPERGLRPLLEMWPALREKCPDAELAICRYNSMYDAGGWGKVCASYDQMVQMVNEQVGGITYLGELGKADLYKAISEAAVMWYPGVVDFAETSCWAPDTPVAVPGGHKRIDQIVAGDLVLSYSETDKRIVAKRVKWCKRTGQNKAVMRLTYKWRFGRRAGRQESIVGTPNHRMLRRDGTWTTLGDLVPGDSLMPLFRKSDGKYWEIGHDGYRYKYEHDAVGEALVGRELAKGEVVHHKNENGLDNDEANLEVWPQSDHIKHHLPAMKAAYLATRPAFDYERLHSLRRRGLSQAQIASEMGTYQQDICRRLAASNHTVVAVDPAGFSDVWDMEVEDTHTFIAGHVVVHNCVAAIESQAVGTPFVGSFKGALPETVPHGVLLTGDASLQEYQIASVSAVAELLDGCKRKARHYREVQQDGLKHVEAYTYAAIAQEWEQWIDSRFAERSSTHSLGVLRQLMHYDDHTAAIYQAVNVMRSGVEMSRVAEVSEASALCQRVILGEEQTAEQYAAHALPDPLVEWDYQTRFHEAATWFAGKKRVLDVACGNGAFALGLALQNPDMHVVGIDYAQGNIDRAKEAAERAGLADRCTFICAPVWDFAASTISVPFRELVAHHLGTVDGIFCGEFLEHVSDSAALVDGIEQAAAPGAVVVYTMPNGPFSEMLERGTPVHKGHVHHFTQDDVIAVFGDKAQISAQYMHLNKTPRGEVAGHWLVRYEVGGGKARSRDYATRIKTTRPKAKLSVGIIMKNAEHDIGRCLESIWAVADEIVIGDTGSTDQSIAVAESFGDKVRVLRLDPVDVDPDGFAGARNKVLDACTGDYHLMIDSDEVLVGAQQIWKYLESGPYNGYAIPQVHLMLDSAPHADKPVRLFKIRPEIRYYGCIHEQPQMGDCNGDITPALEIGDVRLAHTGYLSEGQRRRKMFERNLPLLMKDKERFPDRVLGKLLIMRDLVNLGDYERDQAGGSITQQVRKYYGQAIGLFEQSFNDPAHRYYGLARPFYEIAIQGLNSAMEFEFAVAGRQHGMGQGKAKPARIWVRRVEDVEKVIAHQLAGIKAQLTPVPIDVEPVTVKKEVAA